LTPGGHSEFARRMRRGVGFCVHTGWAACVVVAGAPSKPEVLANVIIEMLGESERFCFHRAAQMKSGDASTYLERLRVRAIANARGALSSVLTNEVVACAIVAKDGTLGDLTRILASHPRIHTAEGLFYRDVLREACPMRARICPPSALNPSAIGKLAPPPWGRDQKLAALAAWSALGSA
jgi:hypothetical protein